MAEVGWLGVIMASSRQVRKRNDGEGKRRAPGDYSVREGEDTASVLLAFWPRFEGKRGGQASWCRAITRRLNVTIELHT